MATLLPSSTRPVTTFEEWVGYVRHRFAQATRLDPWRGLPHVSPLALGSRRDALCLRLAIACLATAGVAAVLLPGAFALSLVGAALLLGGLVVRGMRANRRRELQRTAESEVAIGALVMANNALFDPDDRRDLPGVLVVTRDAKLASDPQALIAMGFRLFALKGKEPAAVPDELKEAAATLRGEAGAFAPLLLPAKWCGNEQTGLFPCWFLRRFLPLEGIDRRIFPVLAHPRFAEHPVELLPSEMWWRKDVDAALGKEFGFEEGSA